MQYLKYTHVDAATGIPCTEAPTRNGPAMPAVTGLEFVFALESEYPTPAPTFYGTAPDGVATDIPGVVAITADEFEAARTAERHAREKIIDAQVVARIREHYLIEDEIKLLRIAPSPETAAWNDYVEECRQWGREQKAAISI